MATSVKPVSRPAARLDASLVLARKGEAMPAIAATQHNNPGLAWGAQPHPHDFQPQHTPSHHPVQPISRPTARPQMIASARLRPDTFAMPRTGKATAKASVRPGPQPLTDDVALTLRIEDETYLRLKYLAQKSGLSTGKVLNDALAFHLVRKGVPRAQKMVLKPEKSED